MNIWDFFKKKHVRKAPFLNYFEVHLVDHCNLNCQGCTHFSPLAKENYTNIETFEKDLKRLSEITEQNVQTVSLMGGEPLLHPNCKDFLCIARKYLPKTYIQFVTNGILLTSQKEDFWQAMNENNIVLRPTVYPIQIDWQEVECKAKQFNIKLDFYNNPKSIKISYKIPIVCNGNLNKKENFKRCGLKGCIMLSNGHLYPCAIPSNIHYLLDYFHIKIPIDKRNGINIYEVKNYSQIEDFLQRPIPLCKYCKGSNLIKLGLWKKTKYDVNEWIEE